MYQNNSIDLLSALYQLTYEYENDINEVLKIQKNKTTEQIATVLKKHLTLNANFILTNIQK